MTSCTRRAVIDIHVSSNGQQLKGDLVTHTLSNDLDGTTVDVVVVGAGYSGLTAASHLVEGGRSVLVLEGRDRVGGRTLSGEVAGVTVDFGAMWVSDRHTAMLDLMKRVGSEPVQQYDQGKNVLIMNGETLEYTGHLPLGGQVDVENLSHVQEKFNALLDTTDVEAIWATPAAEALDSISFEEWLDQNQASASTRALMAIISKAQWGAVPANVSLLHALRYVQAVGGLDHMLAVEGGQQQARVIGGTQEIAIRLATPLGDRVVLGTAVRGISQQPDHVEVHTDRGTVRCKYVISTTAPEHRRDIVFEPALPDKTVGLINSWRMGASSKAFVAYETPFWRKNGLSGEALSTSGPFFITFDATVDDDGPGVLMAFCDARVYDRLNVDERRTQVIALLVALYGEEAASPIDYADFRWGEDDFAPGGPNPAVAPYAVSSYSSALGEPFERVHWAGSETAGEWVGTLNGAILTGLREAQAVERRLSDTVAV